MDAQDEMAGRASPERMAREVLGATTVRRVPKEREAIEDTEATKAVLGPRAAPGRKAVLGLAAHRGMRVP